MEKVLVKVDWLHPGQGGRAQLPQGDYYVAVAKFPHQDQDQWLNNAWSVRLDWLDTDNPGGWFGLAYFAAPASPENWLVPGGHFELYEGPKMIGRVHIVSSAKAVKKLLAAA